MVRLTKPIRKKLRLSGYDYTKNSLYFVTICSYKKEHLFGEIQDEKMLLNASGIIIEDVWNDLVNHYSNIVLYEYCVMPNHFHAIIRLNKDNIRGNDFSLSDIIRSFKTFSSRKINLINDNCNRPNWQRSFYDHIIQNQIEYEKIANYINNNPKNWKEDCYCE